MQSFIRGTKLSEFFVNKNIYMPESMCSRVTGNTHIFFLALLECYIQCSYDGVYLLLSDTEVSLTRCVRAY